MTQDFLFELLTEELPPKALLSLRDALGESLASQLKAAHLHYERLQTYATPRRLAFQIRGLAARQADMKIKRKGPALSAAFSATGEPSPAALGFAGACGVDLSTLSRVKTAEGEWLFYEGVTPGATAASLLPDMIIQALKKLPIPKLMRWGAGDHAFARPVKNALALLDRGVLSFEVFGVHTCGQTFGHRFHHPEAVAIQAPKDYVDALQKAHVLVDFEVRREAIAAYLTGLAAHEKATLVANDALLEEVTALVEWPVALLGEFESRFLEVPEEVLILSMASHQRYFALRGDDGKLLSKFILISNIASKNPAQVIAGNQKVLRARFSDAAFFFAQDKKQTLAEHGKQLSQVVFQTQLGSLQEKTARIQALAGLIASHVGVDATVAQRVAALAKCDLMTAMVGEFPELQGTMGRYYALHAGEDNTFAEALADYYQPRFSGDVIGDNAMAHCVALADRIDTLVGIIGVNQQPTGDKDPFALRRQALGVLRILLEKNYRLDLGDLIEKAVSLYGDRLTNENTALQVLAFLEERFKYYCLQKAYTADQFYAIQNCDIRDPVVFMAHLVALADFAHHPTFISLVAANKRVANILKKAPPFTRAIHENYLQDAAEKKLFDQLVEIKPRYEAAVQQGDLAAGFALLATLRPVIDDFFETVMVMVDNQVVRDNRLSLLAELRALFLKSADFSALQLPGESR